MAEQDDPAATDSAKCAADTESPGHGSA